ncbi:MAG: NAD(P)H-hydrate dehydratase [Kiritimatiellia bacterium]
MKFLTVEQMRAADQAAINDCDIPGRILMNRAGVSLARFVKSLARLRDINRIILVAGHGNNGGDTCVAARCLHDDGFSVHVIMTCIPSTLKGDAYNAWDDMQNGNVSFEVAASVESWTDSLHLKSASLLNYGIVVDGVLGTDCTDAPRGVAAEAVRWINSSRPYSLVVSADLPSGMNGDTGRADGDVVKADATVTFAAPKQGFCNSEAMPLLGHLTVADIGIPDDFAFKHTADTEYRLISRPEIERAYRERSWTAHKGSFGHVCITGGIKTYPNAPVLAAAAAYRSGAGLVTLRSCCDNRGCALSLVPEAVLRPVSLDDFFVAEDDERSEICSFESYRVVVAGPGLGCSESAAVFLRYLLEHFHGCTVLDADALNLLAQLSADGYKVRDDCRLVITPHPGEAARLLQCKVSDVQENRGQAVRELSRKFNAIAVLKGAATLVSDGKSLPWLNLTGNPGMASGGTGDVLSGVIGGLLAQEIDDITAVTMGVWVHGYAGDLAWMCGSQTSLTASDVILKLSDIYQNIER